MTLHELAHAAHQRITPGDLKPGQNPHQEIVAETVAATLCLMYGLDGYAVHSKRYIESYSTEKDAARAVTKALVDVRRCLDLIFEYTTEEVAA